MSETTKRLMTEMADYSPVSRIHLRLMTEDRDRIRKQRDALLEACKAALATVPGAAEVLLNTGLAVPGASGFTAYQNACFVMEQLRAAIAAAEAPAGERER